MKKQLLKKFSACLPSGMAFIVPIAIGMMFSASANAQIVYTDVIPDSTMYSHGNGRFAVTKNYNLDLNNDANNDFILTAYSYSSLSSSTSRVSASPLNGNAVKDTLVNSDNVSIPLQFNAVIDSNLLSHQSWQTTGLNIMKKEVFLNPGQGLWNNLSDYYLGLRLLQSGQAYYGWVRLRVDVTTSYASVIIRDYAYNSIPNQPILAGQTIATGITESSFASSIHLFPNPATNELTISLDASGGKLKIESVEIYDVTGREVFSANHQTPNSNPKISIDVSKFPAGVYAVQIKTPDFIGTKKLIIQK